MAVMSNRNPYPFSRMENDMDFIGVQPQQVAPKTNSWTVTRASNDVYGVPLHRAQQQDPWKRLNTVHTLTSSRREVYHLSDPKAPNDALDFSLSATYDHHRDLLRNRNQTVFHRETFDEGNDGRKLKNRVVPPPKKTFELNHPLSLNCQKRMESMFSVKNSIGSHHTQSTNKGYTRKPDGGFFAS